MIKQLHQSMETTFVYVTHDQAEALTLADRIVVMRDGVIQQIGTPNEIYSKPRNIFVASFLGNPQINLIEGELKDDAGGTEFRARRHQDARWTGRRSPASSGREVLLGVRPEDLRVAPGGELCRHRRTGVAAGLRAVRQHPHRRHRDHAAARQPPEGRTRRHAAVSASIRTLLHVFDRKTGESLTPAATPAGASVTQFPPQANRR